MTQENKCVECGADAGQDKLCKGCLDKIAKAAGYTTPPAEKPAKKPKLSGVGKVIPNVDLTEPEKVQVALILREVATLQGNLNQTNAALGALIDSIVRSRGLDPKTFGVNLAAGKILPLEAPQVAEDARKKAQDDNGGKPKK